MNRIEARHYEAAIQEGITGIMEGYYFPVGLGSKDSLNRLKARAQELADAEDAELEADAKARGFFVDDGYLRFYATSFPNNRREAWDVTLKCPPSDECIQDLRNAGVTVSDNGVIDVSTLPYCGGKDWSKESR